jgi:hypothetical protein
MISSQHVYEVRPCKDHRGVDLISDALPFARLWYIKPDDAVDYAKFRSRSHDAVIWVFDATGNVIDTHEHAGISASFKFGRPSAKETRIAAPKPRLY